MSDEATDPLVPLLKESPRPPAGTGWKRLHPASVAVNLLPRTWRVARGLWPLFLAMLYGGRSDPTGMVDLLVLGLFFVSTVGATIVHWATLRYRVADGRLEVMSGLFDRTARAVDPRRIQNVERVRNVFHRAAGLVEVRIETASGKEVEGTLSALSEAEADALISALEEARRAVGSIEAAPEDSGELIIDNGLSELFAFGATATRFGAGALVVFGIGMEMLGFLEPNDVESAEAFLSSGAIVLVGIGVITGTWLIGTGSAMIRHYGFRLVQRGAGLVATEGLLTQRRVELPLAKVQLVTVREPWLRRLVGFGSVHVETAAARQEGGTQAAEAVVPVVSRERIGEIVGRAIPGIGAGWDVGLRPAHPMALRRGIVGAVVRGAILGGGLTAWLGAWGALGFLLVPLGVLAAWLDWRLQGWRIDERVVVARQGWFDRRTAVVPRDKLQSLEVLQGPLRRRWGLGVIVLRVAGSSVRLPDLGWEEALALQHALVNRPAP